MSLTKDCQASETRYTTITVRNVAQALALSR